MNNVTESETKHPLNPRVCRVCERDALIQESEELMTEVEFLTGVLDDTVKLYRGEYRGYADLGDVLKPYLDRKKPPEPEIKPWTRWRHIDGDDYILTLIEGTYQLRSPCGTFRYGNGGKTPIKAFAGDFNQFTQVEGEA